MNFNLLKGKFTWANGDIYEGEFRDHSRNGFGILKYNDGRRYEGEWKNDKKNGKGIKEIQFIHNLNFLLNKTILRKIYIF